jgi:hypothetical protein
MNVFLRARTMSVWNRTTFQNTLKILGNTDTPGLTGSRLENSKYGTDHTAGVEISTTLLENNLAKKILTLQNILPFDSLIPFLGLSPKKVIRSKMFCS